MEETKRCSKCGEVKPISEYYTDFRRGKHRPKAHCKDCHKATAAARRAEFRKLNELKKEPIAEGYKRCCRCHDVKHITEFSRNRSKADGRHIECKVCVNERLRKKTPPRVFRADDGRLYIESKTGCAGFYWTPNMIADLKRYYPISPNREVAEIFGMHVHTIIAKAKELGLTKDKEYMRNQGLKNGFIGNCMRYANRLKKNNVTNRDNG